MTKKMADRLRKVNHIKALYEEHDHLEAVLVMGQRRGYDPDGSLRGCWEFHDKLERTIVEAESELPHSIVEKLKRGEL